MFRHRIHHVEFLNRIGHVLDSALGSSEGYQEVAAKLRELLELDALHLWVRDPQHRLLIREAQAHAPGFAPTEPLAEYDKGLARWQMHNGKAISSELNCEVGAGPARPDGYDGYSVSLPLQFQEEVIGALNLYFGSGHAPHAEQPLDPQRSELLRAIAGQMAVFAHTRSQVANTTFYKEIHHRIKNNLQTVASLLRMQLRRLDETTAERALTESIQRIMSIAQVHEALSAGDIGQLDLQDIAVRVCRLLPRPTAINLNVQQEGEGAIRVNSKQATALVLVINELVDNAVQHGGSGQAGITVTVGSSGDMLFTRVSNTGQRLAEGFTLDEHGGLGLSIVQTLVRGELKGSFTLSSNACGTSAQVQFPRAESEVSGIAYDYGT